MFRTIAYLILLFSISLNAEVGKISEVEGLGGFIIRDEKKIAIEKDLDIERQDIIQTNTSQVLIHLYPGTQINLADQTDFKVESHQVDAHQDKETSQMVMELLRGAMKILVEKFSPLDETEQVLKTKMVALSVRGTEFEVQVQDNGNTQVDVIHGTVSAASDNENLDLNTSDSLDLKYGKKFSLKESLKVRRKLIKSRLKILLLKKEKLIERWKDRKLRVARRTTRSNFPAKQRIMHRKRDRVNHRLKSR